MIDQNYLLIELCCSLVVGYLSTANRINNKMLLSKALSTARNLTTKT